jgi:hypothetical protein
MSILWKESARILKPIARKIKINIYLTQLSQLDCWNEP